MYNADLLNNKASLNFSMVTMQEQYDRRSQLDTGSYN